MPLTSSAILLFTKWLNIVPKVKDKKKKELGGG